MLHGIRPDELIQLTARLVRIPSLDRAGHREAAVAELLADLLSKRGFDVCLQEVAAGRPNLIAVHDSGTPGPTLLFEAHTDVVTEGDPLAWNHPPFQGVVEGGRIYGRGSCDTKGNLAAAVVAASALKAAGHPRRGRLMLAFPVDEEGMMIGVKHFIEQGWA
ncbi:MAG: M20/M25/M40 family metallo-hydrolase, partial [Actinomycetota bacterium]|nr:M20/M25/M40 family metallo-hydrolase [Actinomycetota bacterium]